MESFPEKKVWLHSDEDYVKFIGNNSYVYIVKFNKYSATPISFNAGWNWSSFFFPFWWFLYRKMYLWSGLCLLSLFIPYINLLAWIGWPIAANDLYYKYANKKISELKMFKGENYKESLAIVGGVNSWVPWVAVALTIIPFAILLMLTGELFRVLL